MGNIKTKGVLKLDGDYADYGEFDIVKPLSGNTFKFLFKWNGVNPNTSYQIIHRSSTNYGYLAIVANGDTLTFRQLSGSGVTIPLITNISTTELTSLEVSYTDTEITVIKDNDIPVSTAGSFGGQDVRFIGGIFGNYFIDATFTRIDTLSETFNFDNLGNTDKIIGNEGTVLTINTSHGDGIDYINNDMKRAINTGSSLVSRLTAPNVTFDNGATASGALDGVTDLTDSLGEYYPINENEGETLFSTNGARGSITTPTWLSIARRFLMKVINGKRTFFKEIGLSKFLTEKL